MAHYQCPLQVEIERLQQIADNLKQKAIDEYKNKGWIVAYHGHHLTNGWLQFTCILLNNQLVHRNPSTVCIVKELIEQGNKTKDYDLVTFKKYISYKLEDDDYIIF
jgi:hypothetical protein